jgi:hypothetical protein
VVAARALRGGGLRGERGGEGCLVEMASLKAMNCIISPRRSLLMDSTNISNLVISIFMGKEAVRRGLFQLRRTSGSWVDEGMVLLQGALASMSAGWENCSCPLLAHERSELPHKAFYFRLCSRLE